MKMWKFTEKDEDVYKLLITIETQSLSDDALGAFFTLDFNWQATILSKADNPWSDDSPWVKAINFLLHSEHVTIMMMY